MPLAEAPQKCSVALGKQFPYIDIFPTLVFLSLHNISSNSVNYAINTIGTTSFGKEFVLVWHIA